MAFQVKRPIDAVRPVVGAIIVHRGFFEHIRASRPSAVSPQVDSICLRGIRRVPAAVFLRFAIRKGENSKTPSSAHHRGLHFNDHFLGTEPRCRYRRVPAMARVELAIGLLIKRHVQDHRS